MTFPDPLRRPIANHLTGRAYELVRACDVPDTPAHLARLVTICNEPPIYDWLFRGPLAGRPYEEAKARQWLQGSREGWAAGTHFVFVVLDADGRIAAACDIKSNDPTAEIGYWASQHHRGVMTNTIKTLVALATEAGFHTLFARVRLQNHPSRGVLTRAGFTKVASPIADYDRFELPLR